MPRTKTIITYEKNAQGENVEVLREAVELTPRQERDEDDLDALRAYALRDDIVSEEGKIIQGIIQRLRIVNKASTSSGE